MIRWFLIGMILIIAMLLVAMVAKAEIKERICFFNTQEYIEFDMENNQWVCSDLEVFKEWLSAPHFKIDDKVFFWWEIYRELKEEKEDEYKRKKVQKHIQLPDGRWVGFVDFVE